MATVPRPRREMPVPALHSGDRMTRQEFHRIYEQMPREFKAELVGGIVYVASPLGQPHGTHHVEVSGLLWMYKNHTPGVEAGDSVTVFLSDEGEPQPDLYLRILPECGGRTRLARGKFILGAPELLVEIAHSSKALDLHGKLDDYSQYGVDEYLVLCVQERQLRWFDLKGGQELRADKDGIIRVRTFPGLWIDAEALFTLDGPREFATLQKGLASPEHQRFVKQLEAARSGKKKGRR